MVSPDVLERELERYEVDVYKVLPRSIRNGDDALSDEIHHMLYRRRQLEGGLQEAPWLARRYWDATDEMDRLICELAYRYQNLRSAE